MTVPAYLRQFRVFLTVVLFYMAMPNVASAVDFEATIEAARKKETAAEAEEKHLLVVTFGSEWCQWCRKMEAATFLDPGVNALADRFLWAKIDVDEQRELAARFRVQGLPHTFIIDGEDRIVADRPGYISGADFVTFLQKALDNPRPDQDQFYNLLARLDQKESAADRRETITRLVEHLSRADRNGRDEILRLLTEASADDLALLIDLMEDDRLSVRAAAAGTYRQLRRVDMPFDPFAAAGRRNLQLMILRYTLPPRLKLPTD